MTDSLAIAIQDFIAYLDTLDYENGDSPILHMSWYRSGNNRCKTMEKTGSSFLSMDCSVALKHPKTGIFQHIGASSDSALQCVSECRAKVEEYVRGVYESR